MALLDRFLPRWEWQEFHSLRIDATRDDVYRALRNVDFRQSRVIDTLIRLRGIPARGGTLSDIAGIFTLLAEEPGREIVFGLTGRFWGSAAGILRVPAGEFIGFDRPGYAQLVWNFRLEGETVLSTETRIHATNGPARLRFAAYWLVVRPFSGWIRREMLRAVSSSIRPRTRPSPRPETRPTSPSRSRA